MEFDVTGGAEGQEVLFSIKDNLDPDDGSETRVPVCLGDDGRTCASDTNAFTTANPRFLHAVAPFAVLSGERVSLDIRNLRCLRRAP